MLKAEDVFQYYNVKEEIGKYVGEVKERYNRFDFEKLMLKKYNARKLNSREDLREYYINNGLNPVNLTDDIYVYSEEDIKSENYDLYIICDKNIIRNYSYPFGKKRVSFFEVYVEYNKDNEVISNYYIGDYSHIYLEMNYFLPLEERFDRYTIDNEKYTKKFKR